MRKFFLPAVPVFLCCLVTLGANRAKGQAIPESRLIRAPLYEMVEEAQSDDAPLRLTLAELMLPKVPRALGALTTLRWLDLGQNKLDAVPPEIFAMRNLQVLRLDENMGIKTLPDTLGSLPYLSNLQLVNMQGMEWQAAGVAIGKLPALAMLDLTNNNFKSLPFGLGNSKTLTHLSLANNHIQTRPDPTLAKLTNLTHLNLAGNFLEDIPESVYALKNLQVLDLRNNRLTHIPPALLAMPALTTLMLDGNPIPEEEWRILATSKLELSGVPR